MNTPTREELAKLIPNLKIKHMSDKDKAEPKYIRINTKPNRWQRRRERGTSRGKD